MNKAERTRLKQLANDAIIASFGSETTTSRLAEALEKCVDELGRLDKCPICGDSEEPDWPFLTNTLEQLGFRLEPL
jgi:hypothetical protein